MPSFTLTTGGSTSSGNDLNLGASETWTVSGSGSSQVSATVLTGPVSVSPSSAAGGSNFTITASSSTTGSYTVRFVQNVGGGRGGSTSYQGNITGSVVSAPATPSYAVSVVNNMNEGTSQTVTVTTSNVSNGTTLYFSIDQAGDFSATSGSFTINNNSGSFTITTTADQTTEGNETKTLRVRTGSTSGTIVGTRSFTVIDTSTTPAPTFSLGSVSNMNEGASQTISVSTTNFGSGTLYFSIDGSGDFTSHSGSVSISNNSGSFTITSVADQTTEGNETKTLRLRTGSTSGTQVVSTTFTLIDTSTASGGGGSGGTGAGGSTTGTANYGVAVFGPNGTSVVFGSNLRTQNIVFSTTQSAVSGTTYGPFSVANANDTNKIQIFADYQVPVGTTNQTVSGSQIIITKSSTGFTFRHTAGGTKTFVLSAVKIA